ncbi:hypothetical protein [Streptomyces griseorubiginosus]
MYDGFELTHREGHDDVPLRMRHGGTGHPRQPARPAPPTPRRPACTAASS